MLVILSSWNLFYMCMRICKSHKVDLNITLAGDVTCLLCNISCCRVLHCVAKSCKLLLVHSFALDEGCTFERIFGHNFPQFTQTGDLQESACIVLSFWHRMEAAFGISTFNGHVLKLGALNIRTLYLRSLCFTMWKTSVLVHLIAKLTACDVTEAVWI